MKKNLLAGFLISGSLVASHTTTSGVTFEDPTYGGSGCLDGDLSSTPAPDGTSLSVIFDAYTASAGGDTHRRLTRKNCELVIPVTLPAGTRAAIVGVDYRGFNNLPCGAQSTFEAEYFLGGDATTPYRKIFYGPDDEEFLIRNTVDAEDLDWTACGGAANLRISTAVTARANVRLDETETVVDSADVANRPADGEHGHTYYLAYESCGTN